MLLSLESAFSETLLRSIGEPTLISAFIMIDKKTEV